MARIPILLIGALLTTAACHYPAFREHRSACPPAPVTVERWLPVPPPSDGEIVNLPGVPLLRLRGTGYERGWQYGRAMAQQWRFATDRLRREAVGLIVEHVPVEPLAEAAVRVYGSHVIGRVTGGEPWEARERFPDEYRGYVRGIADGAEIPVDTVLRMVAFVMLSDASCSAFVAYGPATEDGRLLQLRSLDWGDDGLEAQKHTVLLVHEPVGKLRYLSIGFVGLVGSISGINEAGISLSEIGSESEDRRQRGIPMPLLLEQVLARASTLDEAVRILEAAPGTGGYNFMVGSARERRGAVVEKTARHTAVFRMEDANYGDNPHFRAFPGFDCRADTAADPLIRSLQRCSRGDDGTPTGTSAYEGRYLRQLELFESFGRKLDVAKAGRIAREVAAASNLHSILYDFDRRRVYLRNRAWFADGHVAEEHAERMRVTAGAQAPITIDLDQVFPKRSCASPAAATASGGSSPGGRSPTR